MELREGKIIYVLRGWVGPEFHKIGCTSNVLRRYRVKRILDSIVHVIPIPEGMNMYAAERMVHRLFSDRNVNGHEAFALTVEDLETIKRIHFGDGKMYVGSISAN